MRTTYLAIYLTLALIAGIPGAVQSGMVTFTYQGIVMEGPLTGSTGEGTFTYDDILLEDPNFSGVLTPTDGLMVTLTFDGLDFNETNDADYDEFPELEFEAINSESDYEPVYLNYVLVDGENGVDFNYPDLALIETTDLLRGSEAYDYTTEIFALVIPIPGAFWLLGTGIAGLIGFRITKRRRT